MSENKVYDVKNLSWKNKSVCIDDKWFKIPDEINIKDIKKGKAEVVFDGLEIKSIKTISVENSEFKSNNKYYEDKFKHEVMNSERISRQATLNTAIHIIENARVDFTLEEVFNNVIDISRKLQVYVQTGNNPNTLQQANTIEGEGNVSTD